VGNRTKHRNDWQPDIDHSVGEYNTWYLKESPGMFVDARNLATSEARQALSLTNDFLDLTPDALRASPKMLFVTRMAVSPTMARDRFVGFTGTNKHLVKAMEVDGILTLRLSGLEEHLQRMCSFLGPLLDPGLFPWLAQRRSPTGEERDRALLVLSDRLAKALYDPVLRNSQEARQKTAMRAYLEKSGLVETRAEPFAMGQGTFQFGRNVPVRQGDGAPQNLPVDCVVSPAEAGLPLACVELKSAGDFTNVNKRRKEESDKSEALRRTYDDKVVFLLQLFGYFDHSYLGYEAGAGIDWAWDHRLRDLAPYFGL
jgi:hypothetical protein